MPLNSVHYRHAKIYLTYFGITLILKISYWQFSISLIISVTAFSCFYTLLYGVLKVYKDYIPKNDNILRSRLALKGIFGTEILVSWKFSLDDIYIENYNNFF